MAVKLLRPGLAASVRQDLAMLDSLLAPLSAAFPALDPRTILQEVRDRVLEELDLEHEAQNQRRFHRALRNHPAFTVPAPVTRLATDSVLVSEWIEGTRIADAPDPDQAAARLLTFVLGATRSGAMHVDPHPEDVLITPEGKLAVLDFGLVRAVKPDRVNDTAAALDAFAARDAETFGTLTAKLGSLPAEHAELALDLAYDALGDLAGPEPTRLDTPAVISARDRLLGRPRDLATLLTKGSLPPDDLWPARAAAQLFGSIAMIGATGSWLELSRAALKDGWDAAT